MPSNDHELFGVSFKPEPTDTIYWKDSSDLPSKLHKHMILLKPKPTARDLYTSPRLQELLDEWEEYHGM